MRLAFLGTPEFAVPALRALAEAGHEIARVYTRPPRPAGRGRGPRPSPVQRAAEGLRLDVAAPESFRDPRVLADFAALGLDTAIVVAYGQILPAEALEAPRHGILNVHASLLPRWRGAAPIQRAIMSGDAETGVCVMQVEQGLDTGPVFGCEATAIGPEDTAGTLHDRLARMGAALMVRTLTGIEAGAARATPQPETGVTYARKIDKSEARIDWTRPAGALDAHIRGLSPFPGAWCEIAGERVKVLLARPEPVEVVPQTGAFGLALDDRLLIACGEGALRLLTLQRQGRGAMDSATFLRGFAVPAGTRLS